MMFWTILLVMGWMISYITIKYMYMRDLEDNQQEWDHDDRITIFLMSFFYWIVIPVIIIIGLIWLFAKIVELLLENIMFSFFRKIEAKIYSPEKNEEKPC